MNLMIKISMCALAALALVLSAGAQQDVINTVVGGGPSGMPALDANVYNAYGVATDAAGNFYYADPPQGRVFKATPGGDVTLVAGLAGENVNGYNGDGIAATSAWLNNPEGVAVDTASPPNIYIADTNNCLIRKVNGSTGIISTVAGYAYTNSSGNVATSCGWGSYTDNKGDGFSSTGDGGQATRALLYYPAAITLDSKLNLYIADTDNGRIREVNNTSGVISTLAGGGGSTTAGDNCQGSNPWGDGAAATSAYLCSPQGVFADNSETPPNIFISNTSSACAVREVVGGTGSTAGNIYRVAGSYSLGCGFSGDGSGATSAQLNDDWQVWTTAKSGTTTVTVADYGNSRVRQFTVNSSGTPSPGNINTIAGGGSSNCTNENIPPTEACLEPVGVAYDSSGNYYIGDYGYERVREVSKSSGNINTVAGYGQAYYPYPIGNNVAAGTDYQLYYPFHSWTDASTGNVYIAGYDNESVHVWNSSSGALSLVAGNGTAGYAGDGEPASNSAVELNGPTGVVKDSKGNIYIADYNNCVIREVNASTGEIHTVVGGSDNNRFGCGYKDGSLSVGQIYGPYGVAVDSNNNLYIADYYNCRIREVNFNSSTISTVAGNGTCNFSGDGGPATSAEIRAPGDVSLDAVGNIFIADTQNQRIRKVGATNGVINTIAGDSTAGYDGDGLATSYSLYNPYGAQSDPNGNVFIADYNDALIRWVEPAGNMVTVAGFVNSSGNAGNNGFSGDGGLATSAELYLPTGANVDTSGNLYITDEYNFKIRKVNAFAGFGRSSSSFRFEQQTVGTTSDTEVLTLSAIGATTISSIKVSNAQFSETDDCVGSVAAEQTCDVEITFTPASAGLQTATLTINSDAFFAGNANTVSLQGEGAAISASGSLAFGSVGVGSTANQTVTLKNNGSASATIDSIKLTETTDFSINSSSTCKTGALAGGASCTIVVTFAPQSSGAKTGQLQVSTSDPSPILMATTGTGSAGATAESFSPNPVLFATPQLINTESTAQTVTFKYTGTGTLTLSSIASNNTQFTLASGTCSITGGTTLTNGQSCTFTVTFEPTAIGAQSTSITATYTGSSDSTTSDSVTASGTGTDVSVPATLTFKSIAEGKTETAKLKVTNKSKSGGPTLHVSATQIGGTDPSLFTVTDNACSAGVAATKSCDITIQFAPTAAGSFSATITLTTDGGSDPVVTLSGKATD
jgi:hypothetical protein